MSKPPTPPQTADPQVQPPLTSSPPKVTVKGFMTFSKDQIKAEERGLHLCKELAGNFTGPYAPSKFVDFVPKVRRRVTPYVDFSKVPCGQGQETNMYEPFVEAIEASGCCPKFVLRNTSTKGDATSKVKPDCGLFVADGITEEAALGQCMSLMDIPIEFKPRVTDDAFHPEVNDAERVQEEWQSATATLKAEPDEFHKMTSSSIRNRGQQIDYATLVMALQHRTHVFSVSINGHKARLIRWDRAGACVSEAFDYIVTREDRKTKTNWLAEFLFRYAHATPEQRGFDPNVKKAEDADVERLRNAVEEHTKAFRYPDQLIKQLKATVLPSYPAYNITTVRKTSKDKTEKDQYIVCRPFFEVGSLCSRSTRGYLAYWVEKQKLVFLKDTWRVGDSISEAEIYEHLAQHAELRKYLPIIISCGDVAGTDGTLQTKTQDIKDCPWVPRPEWLRRHVLHRIVQELAIPLNMVRSSQELLIAIRNVLIAIKNAYYEAHVLHRDISINNVMLNLSFEGILNDWDHAIRTDDLARKTHLYRTGTWQFMSIDILQNAQKAHSIHDDIESTFWVCYHTALHFFKIKSYDPIQGKPSLDIFDEMQTTSKTGTEGQIVYFGGDLKHAALTKNKITTVQFECAPLTKALHEFASTLRKYHLWRDAINEDERAPHKQAVRDMEDVDPLIDRFQELIDTGEWPEGDDAVEDQYPKTSKLDEYIQLAVAHEACVTQSHKSSRNLAPQPTRPDDGASSSMPPPASVPVRRVTRSTSRQKNAENAPPLVASGSGVPPSMSRSTPKRHRVGDEDAKVEVESSEGRTKRSRQQKAKPIVRTASSEQTRYNTRSRTKSLKEGGER